MEQKHFSRYKKSLTEVPNLVKAQLESYEWLIRNGLKELFEEFSPIEDYSKKKFKLTFEGFELMKPKYDEHYAKKNKLSYEAPLRVRVKLENKTLGESKEQEIFMADFPLMTEHGTFVINGVERVIVPQLARSYGIFFTLQILKGRRCFGAKIIPQRGAWIEIETDATGAIFVRIDRKRKFTISTLLRVIGGLSNNDELLELFKDNPEALEHMKATLAKDTASTSETSLDDSYVEVYRKLRDGDLVTPESAREFVDNLLGEKMYNLSHVGRFRFNERFEKDMGQEEMDRHTISLDDMKEIVSHIAALNSDPDALPDDIDHLGSRRVRYFGEMFLQKLRVGMSQIRRNVQDKMSTIDINSLVAIQLMSPRPLQARLKEFFTTNQLSQFMNQENPLAEIEHLRTLSALGPGGLTRERAGAEVRDVHTSHYGRVCPIHTPEGPNIGLILHLSMYAQVNEFGLIESPYMRVKNGKITDEVVYLNAFEEEKYNIAHGATKYDEKGNLPDRPIEVRSKTEPALVDRKEVDFIDVAANEAFSVATSMIPFLEHNDGKRALMGSNMQKQATPCIISEAPLVGTGVEEEVARDTGRLVTAREAGTIEEVDARHIVVKNNKGEKTTHTLLNFVRSNGFTALHQRPIVSVGEKVKRGQVLADASSTDQGQMALGQNMLVAFMSWGGANYEDAIIISERVVKDAKFSSIHLEEFTVNVRDTKLGPEVITPDIPNVGENKLKDLDEEGIVRIGAEVRPGDILVGKITPKGEAQLTPEERLLRSLFGEKARDVKDTSLRMDHGKRGRVVGVKIFSRENGDTLEAGIIRKINIEVAQLRSVTVGDKLAGRHGNKGVISRILPEEDMPYMDDGTPVDVILTPLGVPSRMNLGQIFEMHLGLAAHTLGYQAITPTFLGVKESEIADELEAAGFARDGKMKLYDGRDGVAFEQNIAVGYMYILKLHHMVEDKLHMRSIGPYSLITQQPLGGKAQGGGQRFGEMEVWALEGYGAAHTLREVLTVKSDDIMGRSAAFDAIIRGNNIPEPNIPATFNVLLANLRGLALDVRLNKNSGEKK